MYFMTVGALVRKHAHPVERSRKEYHSFYLSTPFPLLLCRHASRQHNVLTIPNHHFKALLQRPMTVHSKCTHLNHVRKPSLVFGTNHVRSSNNHSHQDSHDQKLCSHTTLPLAMTNDCVRIRIPSSIRLVMSKQRQASSDAP